MAIFGKKITTAEMLLKALKDLSDEERTKFEQSFKDRVDESVGAQEEADNEQDTQSADDRIDESVGAENADEGNAADVEEANETDGKETAETDTQTNEEVATAESDEHKALLARIDAQDAQLADLLTAVETLKTAFGEIGEIKSGDFGATEVGDNVDTTAEERDDDRIMSNFYGSAYRK